MDFFHSFRDRIFVNKLYLPSYHVDKPQFDVEKDRLILQNLVMDCYCYQ